MKDDKYRDALGGLSTAPIGSPLRVIRDLNDGAEVWDRAAAVTNQISGVYPTTFFCLFTELQMNGVRKAYTRTMTTSQPFGFWVWAEEAGSADGDEYTVSFPLAAGDYYFEWLYVKGGATAKVDIYIDDVVFISLLDLYSGPLTLNQINTTAMTVTSDGNHTIKIKANGKNVSSTDYGVTGTYISVFQA